MKFGIEYRTGFVDDQLNFNYDHFIRGELCTRNISQNEATFTSKGYVVDLLKVPVIIISALWITWLYFVYITEALNIFNSFIDLLLKGLMASTVLGIFWLIIGVPRYASRLPIKLILADKNIYFQNVFGNKIIQLNSNTLKSIEQRTGINSVVYLAETNNSETIILLPENENEANILNKIILSLGVITNVRANSVLIIDEIGRCKNSVEVKYYFILGFIITIILVGHLLYSEKEKRDAAIQKEHPIITGGLTADEYYDKGIAKQSNGDFKGAIQDYNKAIIKNPKYVDIYVTRGLAKEQLDDLLGAMADFEMAIQIDPKFANAYSCRGIMKIRRKDFKDAINDFNIAIKLNPNNEDYYIGRGGAKSGLDDFNGAKKDYSKAIEINPNESRNYYLRGGVKYDLGDYQSAIVDYSKAIEINPSFSEAYLNRGMARLSISQSQKGCLDIMKAKELGNSNAISAMKKYCN